MTARRVAVAFVAVLCLGTLTASLPLSAKDDGTVDDGGAVSERAVDAVERTHAVAELKALTGATLVHYLTGLGIGLGVGAIVGATLMYWRKRGQIEERFA